MTYHQWLSGTPKFHLSSSAMDEFSSSKFNKPRSRQKYTAHAASTMNYQDTGQAPPFHINTQQDHQATMVTLHPLSMPDSHTKRDIAVTDGPAPHYPITPPSEVHDLPPVDTHLQIPNLDAKSGWNQSDYWNLVDVAHGQRKQQAANQHDVMSRDQVSGNNLTKALYGGMMLPSPPMSPPSTRKRSPARSAQSRHNAAQIVRQSPTELPRCVCTDPMFQTSTDPHFWSKNCTILRSDSYIELGNVVSPTCMAGLPFGGMVEMIVPLPAGEIEGISDFV